MPSAAPSLGSRTSHDATGARLRGVAETVAYLDRIDPERLPQQFAGKAVRGNLEHPVKGMPDERRAVVPDLGDPSAHQEQVHQEVLRLDRIVGLVGEKASVVMRERDVIDGECGRHDEWS